jgi:hypothetical protein
MTTIAALKQALDKQDYAQADVLINADPKLLLQPINEYVPLQYYCSQSNTVTVEWLCQKMTSLNMSIDIIDLNDFLIIQDIYANNLGEMVKVLQKYSNAGSLRQWLVQRQLICILGANFLFENNITLTRQQALEAEGGIVCESAQVLCSAIKQLMATNDRYAEIQESIMNYYVNTYQEDNSEKLLTSIIDQVNQKNKPRVIFNSGHDKHLMSVSIKQQDDNTYQLSFYDANSPDDILSVINTIRFWVTGEVAVVRRINIPANKLTNVVEKLLSIKDQSASEAYGYMHKLHKLYKVSYEYDQNIYNLEKSRCYWRNPAYAILDLFIDKFGIDAGVKEYNNFLTTINFKLLENFKTAFPNQYNEKAINNLEKALSTKQDIQAPKTYAIRAIFSLAVSILAAAVTVCSGWAAIGVPGWAALGAALGPVGLAVVLITSATLIFHEWTLRGLANLAAVSSALVSYEMTPLVIKADNIEASHADNSQATILSEPLLVEHPVSKHVSAVKTKSSVSYISRFFAKAEPMVQETPVKMVNNVKPAYSHKFGFASEQDQSLTMQQDLDALWDVPMRSLVSRLQS